MNTLGQDAIVEKGVINTYKWLFLRRLSQFSIMGLFVLGPIADLWYIKGNLSASLFLDAIPMTEPLNYFQLLATGNLPATTLTTGFIIIGLFYALFAGRAFCGWVCPINVLTDATKWLRRKLFKRKGASIHKNFRFLLLFSILVCTLISGSIIWENLNPVSALHRSILFGFGTNWLIILFVISADLFIGNNIWCSKLCPQGAMYILLSKFSILKVSAKARANCNDCMDCYEVCPEPVIITPSLRPKNDSASPVINAGACTLCGRCIDICSKNVFSFTTKFNHQLEKAS